MRDRHNLNYLLGMEVNLRTEQVLIEMDISAIEDSYYIIVCYK